MRFSTVLHCNHYHIVKSRNAAYMHFRLICCLVIMLAGLFCFTGCTDETDEFTIPFAPVNFTIDLRSYDHILNNALSYKIFTEKDRRVDSDRFGYAGLLVVTDATGNGIYAYDLCCPYEDDKHIRVEPRDDGKAKCPECGSVFVTMYGNTSGDIMSGFGTPERGPATEALQSYRVMRQNGVYRITN